MNPLSRKVTWVIWIILFIQYLFMGGYVMTNAIKDIEEVADDASCAQILDLEMGTIKLKTALNHLGCMGEEGREIYKTVAQLHDSIYPISYGLFLMFTIFALASFCFTNRWLNILSALMPLFTVVFDYQENHQIVLLIEQFPDLSQATISKAAFANQLKWIFVFTSIGLMLSYAVIALVKVIRKK